MTKKCIHDGCKIRPYFNVQGSKLALYCNKHKKDDMINVISKTCKSDWCDTFVTNKYDGYCLFCYMHLFPEKPVSRNYKSKEVTTVEFIKTCFPNVDWKSDKTIQDGCSKRRPDLMLDLGYQFIIVEVDENQHIDYDCSCENKRLMEISKDVNHRSVIFIRFNPDDYNVGDEKIKSCWSINKLGICVVRRQKENEWNERLQTLKQQIEYWMQPENTTDKTVEVIQLFYNK